MNKCQCMWFSSKFLQVLQSSTLLKYIQMSGNKGSYEKKRHHQKGPGCGETPAESAPETAETSRFFSGVPLNHGQNPPPQLILFTVLSQRIRYLSSARTWFIKVFSLPSARIICTALQSWRSKREHSHQVQRWESGFAGEMHSGWSWNECNLMVIDTTNVLLAFCRWTAWKILE